MHYKKEIPYAVEVDTEEFFEEDHIIRMRSVIMVERDTQKGIIIGHKGSALKRVGIEARKDLGSIFWKTSAFGIICKSEQKLAKQSKPTEAFWLQSEITFGVFETP